jgi:hypothetical protein
MRALVSSVLMCNKIFLTPRGSKVDQWFDDGVTVCT